MLIADRLTKAQVSLVAKGADLTLRSGTSELMLLLHQLGVRVLGSLARRSVALRARSCACIFILSCWLLFLFLVLLVVAFFFFFPSFFLAFSVLFLVLHSFLVLRAQF